MVLATIAGKRGTHIDGTVNLAHLLCRYWNSAFQPEKYNFAQYAISQGYSIFLYDRLGTGKSST
jgi:hypothetical protein